MIGIAASTDFSIAHKKFSQQMTEKYSPFLRPPPVDAAPERHGGAKRRRARREGMDSPMAKEAGAGASDADACEASLATLCFTVESDWETTRT